MTLLAIVGLLTKGFSDRIGGKRAIGVRSCATFDGEVVANQRFRAGLAPFRRFWSAHVAALEPHLDRMDQLTLTKTKTRRRR